ncbi:MAG: hypothetical protein JNN13_18720 [Planctomycetes bacterium]|nr:hypothetical protein [Planctomycetota bacterium]
MGPSIPIRVRGRRPGLQGHRHGCREEPLTAEQRKEPTSLQRVFEPLPR